MKSWNKKIGGIVFLLSLGFVLAFSVVFYRGLIINNFFNVIMPYSGGLINKIGFVKPLISGISRISTLTRANISLQKSNEEMLAEIADKNRLEEEVYNLRRILNLSLPLEYKKTDGGVFSIQFLPEGHSMLLNRGKLSRISSGDIVVSPEGILIGIIDEVHDNYSRIKVVTDPDFKATVRVYSGASAIARGAINNGLILDFVSNKDEIKTGDVVRTDGNDLLPPGLLIGTVKSIQNDDSGLFKDVNVYPLIREINLGFVVILSLKE